MNKNGMYVLGAAIVAHAAWADVATPGQSDIQAPPAASVQSSTSATIVGSGGSYVTRLNAINDAEHMLFKWDNISVQASS